MDGWYVFSLLANREVIRQGVVEVETCGKTVGLDDEAYLLINFDDDTYSDLLDVEMKLRDLINKNSINEKELEVIKLILDDYSFYKISKQLNISKRSVASILKNVCEKLAYSLGSYFTNEGYISYIADKYRLNDEQVEIMRAYIK